MSDNLLDKIPGAFEQRMEKRRRMMKAIGVDLTGDTQIDEILDAFPESVVNCYSCENEDICLTWLDKNETAVTPPDFCPNRDLILELLERKGD